MARLMLPFIHGECSFFDPALTPFPTVKTLPFITKYFEPETFMLPIPLTSPPREAFHLAPLSFSSLREAASLRIGARQPVAQGTQQWTFRSSKNKSHPLMASKGLHRRQCTWPAGLLSLRPGFKSSCLMKVLLTRLIVLCSLFDQGLPVTGQHTHHPLTPSPMGHLSGLGILLCGIL